jgi:hypothetical protein
MKPRDLDALVAQARGWNINWSDPDFREGRIHWRDNESSTIYLPEQYRPSTDIAEAMGLQKEFDGYTFSRHGTEHVVSLYKHGISYMAKADTLSAAICLAYLKAKGVRWGNEERT